MVVELLSTCLSLSELPNREWSLAVSPWQYTVPSWFISSLAKGSKIGGTLATDTFFILPRLTTSWVRSELNWLWENFCDNNLFPRVEKNWHKNFKNACTLYTLFASQLVTIAFPMKDQYKSVKFQLFQFSGRLYMQNTLHTVLGKPRNTADDLSRLIGSSAIHFTHACKT